jgi:hypothetical protein
MDVSLGDYAVEWRDHDEVLNEVLKRSHMCAIRINGRLCYVEIILCNDARRSGRGTQSLESRPIRSHFRGSLCTLGLEFRSDEASETISAPNDARAIDID